MVRVSDKARRAQVRLLMGAAFTMASLVFTIFVSVAQAQQAGAWLTATVAGVLLTTWFGLDVWITRRSNREQLHGSGGVTPMTGAKRPR
ncbi:hypothetical protein [Streptacidiphilus fuscans]|uniref:Uncharacterized protein n=1 Tax=Streptacidiphilus fuscans TaxID=2789292 RepID=A0A931FCN4_9ACTN|nr:hypothetical protein [Streptacidiphilus fuscans]MBF9069917.1 hypothetical protein [Streptacidiphilus fuscans]